MRGSDHLKRMIKMILQEYETKLNIINENYYKEQNALKINFAKENDPYKIGDIIQDHIGKIKITSKKVVFTPSHDFPSCILYQGENLTKLGNINKREPIRLIYQFNIKKDY